MGLFFDDIIWDTATILSILAAVVYHYLTSTYSFWERRDAPYLKPEIFYGNVKDLVQFKRSQEEMFSEYYHHFKKNGYEFGGIFQLREPVMLVCSPDLVRDVCIKNFPHFHDRQFAHDEHFDPLSAHLLSLRGKKWKFIRSKLNPAFSTSKLKGMFEIMRGTGEGFVKVLGEKADNGEMIEMKDLFARYAMDIIAAIAFGLEINALKQDSKFLHLGQRYFEPTEFERIMQIVTNTFPWLYKTFKLRTIPKEISDFFMEVVRDTMDYRRKHNIQKNDFLHFLMKIDEIKGTNLKEMEEMKGVDNYNMTINEDSIELTEGVVAAQAFVFFLAGYETSSSAMSACVHTLSYHPEIQEKMFEEITKVFEKHGELSYDALQDLVYVEQVLEETLRVYPPAGVTARVCTKPYRIPNTDIILPKGVQAFIPVYAFHHDPEFFPEPEEFKPERFSSENRKNIIPCSYFPFGEGPRICIGARLAMMEMKMSLALIVKNFKINKCEKTVPFRISPRSFFLAPIDGLWVRLVKR